jgi:3-hydroxyacyl-[acyl-carrier-protein] dehydratase
VSMRDSIAAAFLSGPTSLPDGTFAFEFQFRADDAVFAGHFPGRPLLPGIFQIELVRAAAEKVLGSSLEIREIVRAKFLRPVLPKEKLRLSLKLAEDQGIITARAGFVAGGQPAGETILRLWRKD